MKINLQYFLRYVSTNNNKYQLQLRNRQKNILIYSMYMFYFQDIS